jgi:tetratricopeptide (TPR) repeat protein
LRQLAEESGDETLERYALTHLLRLAREQAPSRAEPLATRLLVLDPEDRDALRVLADSAQRRGDLGTQATTLERLLMLNRRHLGGVAAEGALTAELGHTLLAAGDARAAALRFREAIEAMPNDGPLRRALGRVLAQLGDDAEAVTHLGRAAELGALTSEDQLLLADLYERTGDTRRAAAATLAAGVAASSTRRAQAAARIGDEAQARSAALEALGERRDDEDALAVLLRGLSPAALITQLEELAPKLGVERAATALETWAAKLPPDAARMALERALALEPTSARWLAFARRIDGDSDAASHAFAMALVLDPGSAEAALGRVSFLPADEAIVLLASTLNAGTAAPRDRARMALRIGELHGARDQVSAAHQAYSRALAEAEAAERIDETARGLFLEAARALAATARADRDPQEAEEALRGIIERGAANDADQRLLAELLLERDAIADAIALLEAMPTPGPLYITALERAKQWDKLVQQLARTASTRPPEEARPLLVRASELALVELDDPRLAATLLERAVPLGSVDADIWERIGSLRADRLQDREGAARARARAYAADSSRTHLLLELGDFHHDAAERAPARDYYHSLLQSGTAPPDALARLYLRLAEYARADADALTEEAHLRAAAALEPSASGWRRLIEIYRVREDRFRLEQALLALADLVPPTERLPLLREARALEGPAPLAELDERILALDRTDVESRARVLERLRHAEDPSALYDRLEREVEHALLEGGAIGPEIPIELGRVSLARKDYARAARGFRLAVESGGGVPAVEGAVEALRALGRLAEAAQLVEETLAASPSEKEREVLEPLLLGLFLEVAPERALPLVEAAQRRGAALSLDGAAHRRLLRAEGKWELLLYELDRAVASTPDERFALQREAAEVLEGPLDRPRDAARRYAALFEMNPRHRDLAARARALYIAAGELIYALAIVDQELALAVPEEAPQLKITRGELLLAAGADAEAEAEFLHALITTKRVGRAHAALADVYRKRGDLASALEHLIAAADAPDLEPARAAACAVDAADVLLIEGDTATAERLYQLAAALDPADRRALDALVRLAAAQGAYDRQAELLGRAAALTADRRERARLLHERARLFESELHRDLDAYRAYREAVACDPMLRDAVRSLRMLAEARGEWAVAAEQLYREAALSDDTRERGRLHVRLAQVHEEKLFDTAGALRNLEQAAELFGEMPPDEADDPWPSLIRLYFEDQRFPAAANAAERRAHLMPDDTPAAVRVDALERAAALWTRARDEQRAEVCRMEAAHYGARGPAVDTMHAELAPEAQRAAIEARLRTEPEGTTRIELLRRLVSLLGASDNLAELDARAAELLQRAPDDATAFLARRRVLETARDPAALAVLFRARATATTDPHERAERRYEAGRITENQLYDPAAATIDYEAALDADPDHLPALDALADLAFRTRHLQRARTLYDRLGDRSSTLAADEVARRRGELAEEAGDLAAARAAFAASVGYNPGNLTAQQALARVSMRLDDDRGAYAALRSVLELLPRDALDRAAELRRHLGELAARLGELDDARTLLEAVLADDPHRRDVLAMLTDVYERSGSYAQAADLYARRALDTERNDERAELLFLRGEALIAAGDRDAASDAYLKAADLNPRHAATLRRLVRHYLTEGDLDALAEVIEELEALAAPLGDSSVEAALGLSLRGDEARGAIIAALAQPTPAQVANALALTPWPPAQTFEAALRTASRALGGSSAARDRLIPALEARVAEGAGALPARLALAMLAAQAGLSGRARIELEILSFIAPSPLVDAQLAALPPPALPEASIEQVVAVAARGPLRDVFADLGPLVLGLAVAPLDVDVSPEAAACVAPVASLFGYASLDVALLDRLSDPAWAEPTRPPRLLLQRRFADDPRVMRFATARALHALHAGLGLVHGRSTEDISALIRGAAALFLPDLKTDGPFVRAWQAELLAIGLRPEVLPEPVRVRLEVALANLLVDRTAAEHAPAYADAERLTANRVAYAVTADLRAGLRALSPEIDDAPTRERYVLEDPVLTDLIAFARALIG